MPNRLANESSPYLLQHQNNPVDWYPWGEEALQKAKEQEKPIFLSVGYSACHWCHVMEHESFEDARIAQLLNDNFVSIKVDREERPDLDQIYMNAVTMITGRGGWPMSVFLTPEGEPFYGGTYFPPQAKMGMPGFDDVLTEVTNVWRNKRKTLLQQAATITERLQSNDFPDDGAQLDDKLLRFAEVKLERSFDFTHGGFGSAPKFPHSMDVQVLLRIWKRNGNRPPLEMVQLNLDKMAAGGIYDHLAGGFARYSTDARWLVPHFEKMLYDNALLTTAYLEGYLATGNEDYARVAGETLDYILAYMTDEAGGFHSTEDADSEGEEGKFYVWTVEEVEEILGQAAAQRFCYVYDVSPEGNWEGKCILNLPKSIGQCAKIKGWNVDEITDELAESRRKLLEVRDRRVRPGKDDKILVSWNGLMIDAMARAAGILQVPVAECDQPESGQLRHDEPTYLAAARRAADFILEKMTREDGRLLHSYRQGTAKLDAYLDDYACFANALVTLYEETFEERWIDEAARLADVMLARFRDHEGEGFFYTADDHERLVARQKDIQDGSVPSGNAMAATCLLRLGKLTGRSDYLEAAESALRLGAGLMQNYPTAAGQLLIALDFYLGPTHEIVMLGDDGEATQAALAELRGKFIPNRVLAARSTSKGSGGFFAAKDSDATTPSEAKKSPQTLSPHLEPLFAGKQPGEESPTVFICQDFTCQAPVSGLEQARDRLASLAKTSSSS